MMHLLILVVLMISGRNGDHAPLRDKVNLLADESKGVVGVAVKELETGDTFSFNGSQHFVMHSVFKLPIAITYLHLADIGKFSLNDRIHFTRSDMYKTYSPLRDKYPAGNVDLPIREVLSAMISQSDNCACDRILKLIGGPKVVNHYLDSLGLKGMTIQVTERQMAATWSAQYRNWATPQTLIELLEKMNTGKLLSRYYTAELLDRLRQTSTGAARMKALLPRGTRVAHKTGTSGTNAQHLSPATNDVGIIELPNGHHLAVAILVGDSKAELEVRESVIAKIAKAVWDDFPGPFNIETR